MIPNWIETSIVLSDLSLLQQKLNADDDNSEKLWAMWALAEIIKDNLPSVFRNQPVPAFSLDIINHLKKQLNLRDKDIAILEMLNLNPEFYFNKLLLVKRLPEELKDAVLKSRAEFMAAHYAPKKTSHNELDTDTIPEAKKLKTEHVEKKFLSQAEILLFFNVGVVESRSATTMQRSHNTKSAKARFWDDDFNKRFLTNLDPNNSHTHYTRSQTQKSNPAQAEDSIKNTR